MAGNLLNDSDIPNEFIKFMNYCRDLKFEEKPDSSYLRKIFKDLFSSLGYEYDRLGHVSWIQWPPSDS